MSTEQAFIKGFVKRAEQQGVSQTEAMELLKHAGMMSNLFNRGKSLVGVAKNWLTQTPAERAAAQAAAQAAATPTPITSAADVKLGPKLEWNEKMLQKKMPTPGGSMLPEQIGAYGDLAQRAGQYQDLRNLMLQAHQAKDAGNFADFSTLSQQINPLQKQLTGDITGLQKIQRGIELNPVTSTIIENPKTSLGVGAGGYLANKVLSGPSEAEQQRAAQNWVNSIKNRPAPGPTR